MDNHLSSFDTKLKSLQKLSLIVALITVSLSLMGFHFMRESWMNAYLISFLFNLGIVLGCFPVIAIHYLTGGKWGFPIRRMLEKIFILVPFLGFLFIPIGLFHHEIFSWANPEIVQHSIIIQKKIAYLNSSAFIKRAIFYFLLWSILVLLVQLASKGSRKSTFSLRFIGGVGMVLYALSMTFASVDWGMSLEPEWYSTIYGLNFIISQALLAFCFAAIGLNYFKNTSIFKNQISEEQSRDLGSLIFATTMLWAYINLSQFIIIWSGNLKEEISWYIVRFHGGWGITAILLTLIHFFAPFFLLMNRKLKGNIHHLSKVAILLLIIKWVDQFWLIKPAFHHEFNFHWLDIINTIAIFSLLVFFISIIINKNNIIFQNDKVDV